MSKSCSPNFVDVRDGFDELKKMVYALWSKEKETRKIICYLEEREEKMTGEMKRKRYSAVSPTRHFAYVLIRLLLHYAYN